MRLYVKSGTIPRRNDGRTVFPIIFCSHDGTSLKQIAKILIKMAKNGIAKGANSGHAVTEIERKAKPSHRKGVSPIRLWF